ncbi:MAG: hypothetical protein LBC84_03400, partial [Prevotellaceae bacterium]|nr:hypothetical protein [Prevotellaceae bacterium]
LIQRLPTIIPRYHQLHIRLRSNLGITKVNGVHQHLFFPNLTSPSSHTADHIARLTILVHE